MKPVELLFQPTYDSHLGQALFIANQDKHLLTHNFFNTPWQYDDLRSNIIAKRCFYALHILYASLKDLGRWTFRTFSVYYAYQRGSLHLIDLVSSVAGLLLFPTLILSGYICLPSINKSIHGWLLPSKKMNINNLRKYISSNALHANFIQGRTLGEHLFHQAIEHDSSQAISILVNEGKVSVNTEISGLGSALLTAVKLNKPEAAKTLLQLGAELTADSESDLLFPAQQVWCDVVRMAIVLNRLEIVKMLFDLKKLNPQRIDAFGMNLISYTILKPMNVGFSPEIFHYLIAMGCGYRDEELDELKNFLKMVEQGQPPQNLEEFLELNQRIDKKDGNPFLAALACAAQDRGGLNESIVTALLRTDIMPTDYFHSTLLACHNLLVYGHTLKTHKSGE